MRFHSKLASAVPLGIGVCVGLDPLPERLPALLQSSREKLYQFNSEIISATSEIASAYKPNLAFYERFGAAGWRQLQKTIQAVPVGKLVILDAKRGDIGSTAKVYAEALFRELRGDAATVSPYLGRDALEPFTLDERYGAYVLAVTSNPGGADLQELMVEGEPLYMHVIRMARSAAPRRNVGLVVGATRAELWPKVLREAVDLPLLVPGVGAQGGDPVELRNLLSGYPAPVLVNSSRAIIHASSGPDFASAARDAANRLRDQICG